MFKYEGVKGSNNITNLNLRDTAPNDQLPIGTSNNYSA